MKKLLAIIAGILVVIIAEWLVVSNRNIPVEQNSQKQSEKAPAFSLQDYSGKTVSLSDFVGKPVIVNSWAAWCPFCRKELVDFATVQKELGYKMAIVAIDRAETRDVAKKYTDELGVTHDLVFLLDPSDSFYQSIGGFSMPETIFISPGGAIVFHKRGPMDAAEIREKLKGLFQKLIANGD